MQVQSIDDVGQIWTFQLAEHYRLWRPDIGQTEHHRSAVDFLPVLHSLTIQLQGYFKPARQ